ncbi:hypothetical protein DBV13_09440 [Trueperella pyogenes]|nr:hypothetical protein DBV13_09440 [Trueperella pyogenes]
MLAIITKELRNIKENLPFNAATILSPLLFLFAFTVMVSGGITLPAGNTPPVTQSPFLQSVSDFRAPDGTPLPRASPRRTEPGSLRHRRRTSHRTNRDIEADQPRHHRRECKHDQELRQPPHRRHRRLHRPTCSGRDSQRHRNDPLPHRHPLGCQLRRQHPHFRRDDSGFLFGQLAMTSEWENRTTTLLALAPRSPASLAGAKIVAAFVKAVVAGGVLVGVVALLTPIPIPHPWVLTGTLALMCATFAAVGLILGLAVRSVMTAFLLSLVFSLSLWVAGGGFGDLSYFDATTQLIGSLNPATYALDAVRYSYFGGVLNPLALPLLTLGTCVLLVAAIAAFSRWTHSEKVTS